MQIIFDVVDLLQLHEIWSLRPVVTAFTRLENRQTTLPGCVEFNVDELLPRLVRLKHSPLWRLNNKANPTKDPGRLSIRDLSDDHLRELYPESPSAVEVRQSWFRSAYSRFVVAHYHGDADETRRMFTALAHVRHIEPEQCLDADQFPLHGSPEWIPADITDEIRSLDERYDPAEIGLPAAYVIAESFWMLLVKASPSEIDKSAHLNCPPNDSTCAENYRVALNTLSEVAYAWNRSPSVVGLCYQVAEIPEETP